MLLQLEVSLTETLRKSKGQRGGRVRDGGKTGGEGGMGEGG